jgi:hypothetical protein
LCNVWCREDEASGQITKTIIFCTFTKALDLIKARLKQAGMRWQRLDGRMRLNQRSAATREFDPQVSGNLPYVTSMALIGAQHCIDTLARLGRTAPRVVHQEESEGWSFDAGAGAAGQHKGGWNRAEPDMRMPCAHPGCVVDIGARGSGALSPICMLWLEAVPAFCSLSMLHS